MTITPEDLHYYIEMAFLIGNISGLMISVVICLLCVALALRKW